MSWMNDLTRPFLKEVQSAKDFDVYPYLREFQNLGTRVRIDGRQYINFTSNDYLGLSQDKRVIEEAVRGIRAYGTGLGSSRIQATTDRHVELERRLAGWFGYPDCAVFTTGYQALVGFISTMMEQGCTLILDNLAHASILDGAFLAKGRLSDKLELRFFNHNSPKGLERVLKSAKFDKRLVIVEGLYSLDGDLAQIPAMADLCKSYNALLAVDDAHGSGTLGARGKGVGEHFGRSMDIDILIGTFSKSFGGIGGFVLADKTVIDYIKLSARSFVFSASLPIPQVETALRSLSIMEQRPDLTAAVQRKGATFREGLKRIGFNTGLSNTHIVPIHLGDEEKTLIFGAYLYGAGIIMIPIIYPAVGKGQARLRCNITAAHSDQEMGYALEVLAWVGKELKILPSTASTGISMPKKALYMAQEKLIRAKDVRLDDVTNAARGVWGSLRSKLPIQKERTMKAVQYRLSVPRYLAARYTQIPAFTTGPLSCVHLVDLPEPSIKGERWVKVATRYSGICGSDLAMVQAQDSFSLEPFASFPFVFGHEAVGTVKEVGGQVEGLKVGDRVILDSVLSCEPRGLPKERWCEFCRKGDTSLCTYMDQGDLSMGSVTGFHRETGGGWSPYFLAHQSQLIPVPDEITDDEAVLVDPMASALHPVLRNMPSPGSHVAVYGAGIIGLMAVAALRALGQDLKITALARYDFQGRFAHRLGADHILMDSKDLFAQVAELTGARIFKTTMGKPTVEGGFDQIFDCVGSADTVDNALRFLRGQGKLVVVGAAGELSKVDFTPLWFREMTVTGSLCWGLEPYQGQRRRAFEVALDLIKNKQVDLSGLITHRFRLGQYRQALKVAMNKRDHRSIKVIFNLKEPDKG